MTRPIPWTVPLLQRTLAPTAYLHSLLTIQHYFPTAVPCHLSTASPPADPPTRRPSRGTALFWVEAGSGEPGIRGCCVFDPSPTLQEYPELSRVLLPLWTPWAEPGRWLIPQSPPPVVTQILPPSASSNADRTPTQFKLGKVVSWPKEKASQWVPTALHS